MTFRDDKLKTNLKEEQQGILIQHKVTAEYVKEGGEKKDSIYKEGKGRQGKKEKNSVSL